MPLPSELHRRSMIPNALIMLRLKLWKHQALLAWQAIFGSLLIFLENKGVHVRNILPVRCVLPSTLDYIHSKTGFEFSPSVRILPLDNAEISRKMPLTISSEIHPSFLKARKARSSQQFLSYLPGAFIVSSDGVVLTPD